MNTAIASLPAISSPVLAKPVLSEKHFTPLVTQFLDYLRFEKHFSDYTVKSYGADLIQFDQFLAGEIGPAAAAIPVGVTPPKLAGAEIDDRAVKCEPLTIREFLAYLYGQNYTKSTTARKLATLRSFYKFLIRRGIVSASPLITIRTPKQEKRLPKCLDLEQVQKLLEAPGDADLLSARDKAMLEVLYSSGIRVSELVELEMGDIDLQEGVLRVKGKGRKDRLTPIGSQAIKAVQRYFELRMQEPKCNGPDQARVFLNKHGETLSTRSVRRKLDKYLLLVGLDPGISPHHASAHSFATHLLNNEAAGPAKRAGAAGGTTEPEHDADLHASEHEPGEGSLRFGRSRSAQAAGRPTAPEGQQNRSRDYSDAGCRREQLAGAAGAPFLSCQGRVRSFDLLDRKEEEKEKEERQGAARFPAFLR